MFGQKYRRRKNHCGKTSRPEISSPESEPGRKGSKSGALAKIGRYHMYAQIFRHSFQCFMPILSIEVIDPGNKLQGDVSDIIASDHLTSPFSPRKAPRMSP